MNVDVTIVGLVGGVASGKSAVAAQFVKLGAQLLDGDKLGHQVLELPEVIQAARDRWNGDAITDDGRLDRRFVANRVFRDSNDGRADLRFWESVTHPRITAALESSLAELPKRTIVVLDAAVMFKAGWDEHCHTIVFVDVPAAERHRRAIEQRGWTEEHFQQREASQVPLDEKRRRATTVIDNSGSLEETYEQVLTVWNSLSVDPR